MNWRIYLPGLWLACLAASASAQPINGSSLAFRSSGSLSGSDWTLSENGYVGTYIKLDLAGDVTIAAQASGQAGSGANPSMNFVLADSHQSFDVEPSSFTSYSKTFSLPAGTYFLRTEFNNQDAANDRKLTVRDLAITGAQVLNTTTQTTNDGYALQAADDYIKNYRKGPAQVTMTNPVPGANLHVKLKQHAFNFGTAVGGTFVGGGGNQFDVNTYLNNTNYTNFLLKYFNTVTQGNAGKWDSDEATRDVVTMAASDRIDQFAVDYNLRVRQHNLIWGSQQPAWVNTLITTATNQSLTQAQRDAAKADLRQEIGERIDYYLGNNDANTTDDRAAKYKYIEMDLLNEEVHQPKYWSIYAPSGIADVFNESAAAVTGAGANTRLALNEYNVLQFGTDAYGNWFRRDTEAIKNNGGAVSAIGVQYYPLNASGSNAHSPSRITQTFANLAVTGLPLSLTEFGVQTAGGTTVSQASTYLTDTMRLTFGNPNVTTFDIWGFWANDIWSQAPLAALRDANWNTTVPGTAFEQLMGQWTTDVTLPVDQNGNIDFTGFFGDYDISIGVYKATLSLVKGTNQYMVSFNLGAGDYNFDGIVNAADYSVWNDTYGSTTDLRADGNGDGMIDQGDYDFWVSKFGTSYLSGAGGGGLGNATVPEPGTLSLLCVGMAGLLAWRRKRHPTPGASAS